MASEHFKIFFIGRREVNLVACGNLALNCHNIVILVNDYISVHVSVYINICMSMSVLLQSIVKGHFTVEVVLKVATIHLQQSLVSYLRS